MIPTTLMFSMSACANQDFLKDSTNQIIESFNRANAFKESKEPQTNEQTYELGTHDIKETEEVPLELLEDFDLTGPQNNGIVKPSDNSMVSNESIDIQTEEDVTNCDIYVYTAGNPESSDAGLVDMHFRGSGHATSKTVLVPTNMEAFTVLLGKASLRDPISADEFQMLLTNFSSIVDDGYLKALNTSDENNKWCAKIVAGDPSTYLDKYWNLNGSVSGGIPENYKVKYTLNGRQNEARCAGFYGTTNSDGVRLGARYVTMHLLFSYYAGNATNIKVSSAGGTDKQYQIFSTLGNVFKRNPGESDEDYRKRFMEEFSGVIPAANAAMLSLYRDINNYGKLNQYGASASAPKITYVLNKKYQTDSYAQSSAVSTSSAKACKDMGQMISTDLGVNLIGKLDKGESNMYHSFISAYVDAYSSKAKAFVMIDIDSAAGAKVYASDEILSDVKEGLKDVANISVNSYNRPADAWLIEKYKMPVIKVCIGKNDELISAEQRKTIADKLSDILSKKYGNS